METLSLLISFAACLGSEVPASGPQESQPRRVTIVYTVNSFGSLEPMGCPHKILHDGGLPRRMTCLRQLAAAEGSLLILDGGSALYPDIDKPQDGDREKLLLNAEYVSEAYSRMGYRAMSVGTSDLLLGLGELTHIAERTRFPLLCANLEGPSGYPFKPSIVVETNGVKVGVIGLLLDTIGVKYLERVLPGAKVLPVIPSAQKAVNDLRGKADLIVLLSHVKMDVNRQIAKEVSGIDLIIDPSIEYSNHHPRIKDEDWEEAVGKTVILRADGNGSSVGVVHVDFRGPGKGIGSLIRYNELGEKVKTSAADESEQAEMKELAGRNFYTLRRLPLSPHYPDDPEGAALADAHKKGEDVAKVPQLPAPGARDDYLTAEVCKQCHEKQYENWTHTSHYRALDGILASGAGRLPECISCHTTGYGPAFLDPAEAKTYAGVQCEACHGTRPDHIKSPVASKFGAVAESTCLPCHNEDVTRENFSFSVATPKVRCPSGK